MTTDWWSVQASATTGAGRPEPELAPEPIPEPDLYDDPEPVRPSVPPLPPSGEPEPDEVPDATSRARSKAKKVMGSVAVVVVAGVLAVNAFSGDKGGKGDESKQTSASAPAEQGGALPAAGAGPTDLPAAGGGPAQEKPSAAPAGKVTLTVKSSGKADQIGTFVEVVVRNDTRKPVTLLGSLFRGDGHQALVGEGTLVSGSRVVQPGESADGTVEFLSNTVPHQVALLNEAGGVVAVADKG